MLLSHIARDDVFPVHRARALGIERAELHRLERSGAVHRLHHGWLSTRAPADAADRHRLRAAALLQQYAGRAVLSDVSALLRLGLPTYGPDWNEVQLMRTTPTGATRVKAHRAPGVVVRPALDPAWREQLPPSEATVHPAVAVTLAGLVDPRAFLVPADAALRRRLVTTSDLELAVEAVGRRPGIDRARVALAHCDARHESPGETVTAWVLHHLGFVTVPQFVVPGTEVWTPGGRGYRADLAVVGTRVLVEFDGRDKYASRDDLWAEKQREDRIRSLGWELVRVTWSHVHDPDRVRELVDAARARASTRPGR